MEYVIRKPKLKVDIIRPDYGAAVVNTATFVSNDLNNSTFIGNLQFKNIGSFSGDSKNNSLVAYSFKEELRSINNNFNLSFTLAEDKNGLTWLDKIELWDLVFIYEFEELRFIGIVKDKRYSAKMSGEGPQRDIEISGVSLSSLLATFNLIIDQFLFPSLPLAKTVNEKLQTDLSNQQSVGNKIKPLLKLIYDDFLLLATALGDNGATVKGIKPLLDSFIEFGSELSEDTVFQYAIALSIYNVGENHIWSILNNIITPPMYEMFPRWDSSKKKYSVVFRQSPFDADKWKALKSNTIPIIYLGDHDLGVNADEVYTYFLACVAGSNIDDKKGLVIGSDATNSQYGQLCAVDLDKWRKYGYRPLIVEFKYFDTNKNSTMSDVYTNMKILSNKLMYWYQKNDEFFTGSLNIQTIDSNATYNRKKLSNPRIGEKLTFLNGAEFYIESSEHKWHYGNPMTTTLHLTRGYVYDLNTGSLLYSIKNPGRGLKNLLNNKDAV